MVLVFDSLNHAPLFPKSLNQGGYMKTKRIFVVFVMTPVLMSLFLIILVAATKQNYRIQFVNVVCLNPHEDYSYHTCAPFDVTINDKPYDVPKRFETNLASIPRFLWSIFPPQYTEFVEPAVLHDYMYSCPKGLSRRFADDVLYSALIHNHVSKFTASIFWISARLFGDEYFNNTDSCALEVADNG